MNLNNMIMIIVLLAFLSMGIGMIIGIGGFFFGLMPFIEKQEIRGRWLPLFDGLFPN